MAYRSDFAKVWISKIFNDTNPHTHKDFTIEGTPLGPAYLLIQQRKISTRGSCQVKINEKVLKPPLGATGATRWGQGAAFRIEMMDITRGVLKAGTNTIEILRMSDDDDFQVRNVVVHWREQV